MTLKEKNNNKEWKKEKNFVDKLFFNKCYICKKKGK